MLIDTGPLVAYLVSDSEHHAWAVAQWERMEPPLYTCEAVLAEADHLLRRDNRNTEALRELSELGVLEVSLRLGNEVPSLKQLIRRYRSVPMSLADACLVRLSEFRDACRVMTLDSDFKIYRRHARQIIPLLMPSQE